MHSSAAVTHALGGIATREQILAAGSRSSDIAAAVGLGELRRIRRAHYATRTASRDAVDAVRVGGRLGGVSAARSYGLWSGFDQTVHVVLPRNASRLRVVRERGAVTADIGGHLVTLHWTDTESSRERWRVSLLDCLRQVAAWADHETAMACLDTALDLRMVSADGLRQAFAREPAASRARSAAARPGSGSGYESIVTRRLQALGLRVRQQVAIAGVGRIDAEVDDFLLLEIDGSDYHENPVAYEVDRRRDAGLVALGRSVIRLSTRRIRDDWNGCIDDILSALRFQDSTVQKLPNARL